MSVIGFNLSAILSASSLSLKICFREISTSVVEMSTSTCCFDGKLVSCKNWAFRRRMLVGWRTVYFYSRLAARNSVSSESVVVKLFWKTSRFLSLSI